MNINDTYRHESWVEQKIEQKHFTWLSPWKRVYMMLNNETQELQMFNGMVQKKLKCFP